MCYLALVRAKPNIYSKKCFERKRVRQVLIITLAVLSAHIATYSFLQIDLRSIAKGYLNAIGCKSYVFAALIRYFDLVLIFLDWLEERDRINNF